MLVQLLKCLEQVKPLEESEHFSLVTILYLFYENK